MSPILFNGDCNFIFASDYSGGAERYTAKVITDYVDVLADSGVDTYLINVNGQKPWYPSARLEHVLTGYTRGDREHVKDLFPPLGDDFNEQQLEAAIQRQFAMLDRMMDLTDAGIDWLSVATQRCRERGVVPWASIRMNDAHGANNWDKCYFNCPPQRDPAYRLHMPNLDPSTGNQQAVCDYRHQVVRDYYFELIREMVESYDVDGIEMDWTRMPLCLEPEADQEAIDLMTDWVGAVRKLTGGRTLGVRCPVKLDALRTLGLDVAAWAQRQLIDYVAPSNFWQSAWDVPFADLRRRVGDDVKLYGVLEGGVNWLFVEHEGGRLRHRLLSASPTFMRGLAAAHLAGGADGLYFFNFFCTDARGTHFDNNVRAARYEVIPELAGLEKLRGSAKQYTLSTAFNYWSPRFTELAEQLPTTIEHGLWRTFQVPACAEQSGDDRLELFAQVVIERQGAQPPRLGVSLNGSWPSFDAQVTDAILFPVGTAQRHAPQHLALQYRLPVTRLRDGLNDLTVYHSSEDVNPHPERTRTLVRIVGVELGVSPA